jgi:hypothetical protein
MFFTKAGKALAYLGLAVGILSTAYGYWLGSGGPQRWSRNFGPLVKVDCLMRRTV